MFQTFPLSPAESERVTQLVAMDRERLERSAAVNTQSNADRAFEMGREHGKARGSWVIDGNTSTFRALRIIQGYEDCNPEVMDMEPAPLSGEWADDPTPESVYAELGVSEDDDPAGQLLTDYELGFSEGFWDEVQRAARGVLS